MKKIVKTPKTVEKVVEKVVEEVISVVDVEGGPLTQLGKKVYVTCTSFAYYGKLVGVNDKYIELEDPVIAYATGDWSRAPNWNSSEKLPTKTTVIYQSQIENQFVIEK